MYFQSAKKLTFLNEVLEEYLSHRSNNFSKPVCDSRPLHTKNSVQGNIIVLVVMKRETLWVTSVPYDVLLWSAPGAKMLGHVFWVLKSGIHPFLHVPFGLYLVSSNLCEKINRPLCYSQRSGTGPLHFRENLL